MKASSDNNQTRRLGEATITRETRVIDLATRPEILSKDDTRLRKQLAPLSFDAPPLRLRDRSAQGKPVLATVLHIHRFLALCLCRTCSTIIGYRRAACRPTCGGRDRRRSRVARLHLLIARRRANVEKRNVAVASEASSVSKSRYRILLNMRFLIIKLEENKTRYIPGNSTDY
jgi:hypothetical protein